MKKIIMALAVACVATISQAATANWRASASNVFNGTGSSDASAKYSGTAYLFDSGLMSQSDLFDIFAKDTKIGTSTKGYVTTAQVTAGSITATAFEYGTQSESAEKANHYGFYFVLVEDGQIYFSNEKDYDANATSTAKTVGFGTQNAAASGTYSSSLPVNGFKGAGYWQTADAPEPTSGLMMLLGLAGLALRRRCA